MTARRGVPPRGPRLGNMPPEMAMVEAVADEIVELLNSVKLTADQAERIAVVASARVCRPRFAVVRGEHVLSMIDGATLGVDDAKLIGIRAIRRARFLQDMRGRP